jgi:hypothetical protein
MIRMAGIDPGSVTGLVVVDVPDELTWAGASWVTSETFFPSKAKHLTELGRDRVMQRQIVQALRAHDVRVVAIECAAEAKIAYRGQRRQKTETAFRSGCYYMLSVTAAEAADCAIRAYPAVTSKARGIGWMGTSPRRVIVPRLALLLQSVGAPPELRQVNEDGELRQHHLADALGVLAHHVNDEALLRSTVGSGV